ncbi:hypothetical protein COS31_03035 [Candidatus Roizmanbacteria bacterium CG02_land_8_20_14_3_00_36_15]|uniref:Lactamase n=2 Tax=Candidatus Roizmaniibacteriota TaxID=1752723 RepID=A0A2M8KL08_9BACT|nr:MAG: hypothetical protein COS31_03035 [Candidatus Roizmanbacteria bacterium CG02_land_8_20_14_3_00_36_15]PJA52762.1 MAG: hypothetical protein CO166_04380 [Candidatus Roizmanbacteria bacterium CG_4_9_14_3_um_filter_36_11]PJC81194.1 MAG: hypothetical protein CO007_05920 [Candidatus Roizmanbacteria bacterium CG_4_8_14_3_um_filter_36_10]PJE60584.1 MAG: hypothetical protein COU86_03490 [Candidatus Roizmanbacteria bacterium CG10_big_fil_rev_8_21_14_0_10_36_26]
MEIKYLGHSSFFIKTKTAKLVTDPFDPELVGLKFSKIEADIVTVSHQHKDHNQVKEVGGSPLIVDLPGEYEKNGMRIFGYSSYHDKQKGAERGVNTLYKIEAEGISVLHCGDLGVVLEDSFIDAIGVVDVLLIPVGGFYTIDPAEAAELVKKFEPSLVIPMHYNQPKLEQKNFGQLSNVDEFFKKLGVSMPVALPKLVIKGEELEDEMKVILLELT